MKFPSVFLCAVLASESSAFAWKWTDEPQPVLRYEANTSAAGEGVLRNRAVVNSDAGAPLAWDQSSHILYSFSDQTLIAQVFVRGNFYQRVAQGIDADPAGGLSVDSGRHFIFYLDRAGLPNCAKRVSSQWRGSKMGEEPLTRILAVNALTHDVFGYDANARGIRRYSYSAKAKSWRSEIIASGLGMAGDAAVVDPIAAVIYSTHEEVDTTLARHPNASSIADPTGLNAWKPWPLVATHWDGAAWTSRILDETGVPQLPAVRLTDHRVFYARSAQPALTFYYQPSSSKFPESFGSETGWTGAETFVDDSHYTIRAPQYPRQWFNGSYGSATSGLIMTTTGNQIERLRFGTSLQGPITIVPYYEPVWSDMALPPRLTHFRAIINPKMKQLVQHREIVSGEILREQTGQHLAGYLYRDANGVLARSCWIARAATSAFVGRYSYITYTDYPPLDGNFDPTHPPTNFADLSDGTLRFQAAFEQTTAFPAVQSSLPTHFSTDPNAPFVAKHLRLPTAVNLSTFGHDYRSSLMDQSGGRYQEFRNFGTRQSRPSQLAVDTATGATFYTQSPVPLGNSNESPRTTHSSPPMATFLPEPDPKWPAGDSSGWIVIVY